VAIFLGEVADSFDNFEGVRIKDLEFLIFSFYHLNLKRKREAVLRKISDALGKIPM